jgi:hypothetical protein
MEGRTRHGVVTAFVVDRPDAPPPIKRSEIVIGFIAFVFLLAVLVTAIILAMRSLRLGRADVRDACLIALVTPEAEVATLPPGEIAPEARSSERRIYVSYRVGA